MLEGLKKSNRKGVDEGKLEDLTVAIQNHDWSAFDKIIVAFSGGKDSCACFLHLLEVGVPRDKLELWHHDIDGQSEQPFMDWACTPGYCEAVAEAFDVPLYHSWREGGFEREMLRDNQPTAPVFFQQPDGTVGTQKRRTGKPNTRRKFPQKGADLQTRWCSGVLKIDVASTTFCNDPRFKTGTYLMLTGERREESGNRAKYDELVVHKASNKKRTVLQWRAVIDWTEAQVWDAMKRHGVVPHVGYQLGWGRLSCALCIFGGPDQWASARDLMPNQFRRVEEYEADFGFTIDRKLTVLQMADKGCSTVTDADPALLQQANCQEYMLPVRVDPEAWQLPAGAFKECGAPC